MSMIVTVLEKQGDIGDALSACAGRHLDSVVQKYLEAGLITTSRYRGSEADDGI
tara:strand:+ start:270 stop:431 length:162 start_codon:yes stop_codon:yes gene_type:complete